MSNSLYLALGILVVCGQVAGCGSAGGTLPEAIANQAQGSAPETEYIIGPGDGLQVFVWRNPDLTTNVQVRPDGRLSMPLVEDIQAAGKTPSALAGDIEAVLAEYVRTPSVTVIVSNFGVGAYGSQVRVVGSGAGQPQTIPYRQGLTLLDVMIEVGLTEFAAGNRAKLVRRVGGEFSETRVRLDSLVNRGDLTENLPLSPGDVLIIPETRF